MNNDLESNFKFNKLHLKKLNDIILVGVDTYLESTSLSLKLKQKTNSNNFNVHNIGPLKTNNLKNKTNSLGSTISTFISIIEGIHLVCQNIKNKNSLIVINSEIFKRKDDNILNLLSFFKVLVRFCNISVLNSSIYETGIYSINNFLNLSTSDFINFSSIYLLNVLNIDKKLVNNLFHLSLNSYSNTKVFSNQNIYINQSHTNNNYLKKSFYLPVKNFFENEEMFFNNKGILKYTLETKQNNKLKSNWKLIRVIFNKLKKKSFFVDFTNSFNFSDIKNKKNLLNAIYYTFMAANNLKLNNFYLKTNALFFAKKLVIKKKLKFTNTKLQYWLNDFYIGGKDSYSSNSLMMIKCSNITRLQKTNFY
jgi:hypothetical protein